MFSIISICCYCYSVFFLKKKNVFTWYILFLDGTRYLVIYNGTQYLSFSNGIYFWRMVAFKKIKNKIEVFLFTQFGVYMYIFLFFSFILWKNSRIIEGSCNITTSNKPSKSKLVNSVILSLYVTSVIWCKRSCKLYTH